MYRLYPLFLYILKCAVHNRPADIRTDLTEKEWSDLFFLSAKHDVLPLVMNAVHTNKSFCSLPSLYSEMKRSARKAVIFQSKRTADFVLLYEKMNMAGLYPCIVKGIICRNLYNTPELRFSVDEDLLINPDDIDRYHFFLFNQGFVLADPDTDPYTADEVSYRNPETNLYLEVHKHLFPPTDQAYGHLNTLFEELENPVMVPIYGTVFHTLGYTDHFLYLITHAYKHVIYSGIGIRQICDIALYAEEYGQYINWDRIYTACRSIRLDVFLAAVLAICRKYLDMDPACITIHLPEVDEKPLLEDILSGGTYGAADENRLHSATMTLRAITADKTGVKSDGLRKSLFPSKSYMMRSYPYLKKHGYLLPVAWIQRIYTYLTDSDKKTDPGKTIGIGKKRIELLKKYKIIG